MSETQPNDPQSGFHDPDALTRGEPKAKARKGAAVKPEDERDADLARLADLQKEYLTLRDTVKNAVSPAVSPGAEALARKGEVAREITEIKRKHDLSL